MSNNFVKGTAILTIGMFLSKILGLVYIFPLYALVGEENMPLYNYAYIPYSIMLSIAISGVPLAFSKFVSKYNSIGDYETGRRLLKSGMIVMIITGFLSFLIMFFSAEFLAKLFTPDGEKQFSISEVAFVIRLVSFALIIVPFMSLLRGFFQGYNYMQPTAISQLVEQIVRIVFLLGGAYAAVYIFGGTQQNAIQFAVFAAFIGAIGGVLTLFYYWKKKKPEYQDLLDASMPSEGVRLRELYKEISVYAVPIIFVGIANPLFQMVDLITFNRAMTSIGINGKVSEIYLGMLNTLTHKLVMIPTMLALAFSMALIPLITNYYTNNKHQLVVRSLNQTFQIILFMTVPAIIGISLLADDFYHFFYSESEVGSMILAHYAPAAILFGLYPVTASILQGIDRQKWIILNLLTGLLFKLALNIPLIKLFETDGAILATMIGYGVAIAMNIGVIVVVLDYRSRLLVNRIVLIGLLNIILLVAVFATNLLLNNIYPTSGKLSALTHILISAFVGGVIYAYASLRLGIAQKLFGERLTKYTKKFGF